MTYQKRESFEVSAATSWDLTLASSIMEGIPVVGMLDRNGGCQVGVKVIASKDNGRMITVVSESGLRLAGTISVTYAAAIHAVATGENPSYRRTPVRRSA